MGAISDLLLPIASGLFILVAGGIVFKKFLKFVIIVSLIIGGVVFYSQQSFAFGISDLLGVGENSEKSDSKKEKLSRYVVIQNDDGSLFYLERKKYRSMQIIEGTNVILFDKIKRYDLGEISSDPTIQNIIDTFFPNSELLNTEEEQE